MHDKFEPSMVQSVFSIELQSSFFISVGRRQNWKPLLSDSESLIGAFVYWKLWARLNSGTATKEASPDCSWIWQLSPGSRGTGIIPCISSTGAVMERRHRRLACDR